MVQCYRLQLVGASELASGQRVSIQRELWYGTSTWAEQPKGGSQVGGGGGGGGAAHAVNRHAELPDGTLPIPGWGTMHCRGQEVGAPGPLADPETP